MQRVDHHHEPGLLSSSIDLVQARIPKRNAVDMAADLDAAQAERSYLVQPLDGERCVLHRHHSDPDEMPGMRGAKLRDPLVHVPAQRVCVAGRKPMRQQFRHRRDDLHVDVVGSHVVDTTLWRPSFAN